MLDAGGLRARLKAEATARSQLFARKWMSARIFLSSLRIVWVSCASLLIGALTLVHTKQGQDLFLDVRGGFLIGTAFWAAFYVIFILMWVLPIYFSSRWILSRVDSKLIETPDQRERAQAYEDTIPRVLATTCFLLLLLGQLGAIADAPYIIDAQNTVRDPKNEIKFILAFVFAIFCIATFTYKRFRVPASLADASAWRSNIKGLLITLVLLLAPLLLGFELHDFTKRTVSTLEEIASLPERYVGWTVANRVFETIPFLLAGLIVSYFLSFFSWRWVRLPSVIVLIVSGALTLVPVTIGLATLLSLDLKDRVIALASFEIGAPLGIGHLAILPVVTFLLGYAAWYMLAPGSRTRATVDSAATRIEGITVGERRPTILDMTFAALLVGSLAIVAFQFLYHPVDITQYVYRAQLLPFLLGLLVPVFTFISYWSFRWHAPIFLTAIVLLSFVKPDTADVRTTKQEKDRLNLEQAVLQWEKANGCDRKSADPTLRCPSPVIVAVAGGASRSAFLLGAVMGKLLDETKTKSGVPLRAFENQLFAISGVSGGSLGASVTYAALADAMKAVPGERSLGPPPCRSGAEDTEWFTPHIVAKSHPEQSWRQCLELLLSGDFLSPVMASLVSNDIFGISPRGDRAVILENAWERRYARYTGQDPATTTLSRPMTSVRARAMATNDRAWVPMLVLGGTSVSTGRRILTSDIDTLLSAKLNNLRGRLFRDSYDLHELIAPRPFISSVSFSPDGTRFLVHYDDGDVSAEVWDTKTGTVQRRLDVPRHSFWAADSEHILSEIDETDVRFTKASTGEVVRTIAGAGRDPQLSPNGALLLTAVGESYALWDAASGQKIRDIPSTETEFYRPTFSRDNRSLIVVSSDDRARWIKVFEARSGTLEADLLRPDSFYGDLMLSDDRSTLYGASSTEEGGRSALAIAFPSGKTIFDTGYGYRIARFSPDGKRLMYAKTGSAVHVRDIETGKEIELPGTVGDGWLEPSFSHDGTQIMFWGENQIGASIYDAIAGTELMRIRGQEGKVREALFHPDGKIALTFSDNGLGRLWNLETGEELYVVRATQRNENCDHCDIRLSTAATMSARFPIISPHGNIRKDKELMDRVVDGGYYENFGALTALELADELRGTQFGLDPRIILINNEPQASGMSCLTRDSQINLPNPPEKIIFGTVRSPVAALYATGMARGTHAAVDLCSRIGGGDKFAFVTVVQDKRDLNASLSMSWWLSKHVQLYLDRQVDTATTENNADAFRIIESWRKLN